METPKRLKVIKPNDPLYKEKQLQQQKKADKREFSIENLKQIGFALEGAQSNARGQEKSLVSHLLEYIEFQDTRLRNIENALFGA